MSSASPAAAPLRTSVFRRWLHRSYRAGSGAGHYLEMRIKPAGVAAGLAAVVAATLAMGQPRPSVLGVFALAAALVALGLAGVFFRRARLAARRELPRHATAGEAVDYTVVVRNAGKRRLSRAWLREIPPDPRPGLADFATRREPGEERRNLFDRIFGYYRWKWLMNGRIAFAGGNSQDEIVLARGAETRVRVRLTPTRRGVIQLDDLRVLLPDGLGLAQRCRRVPAPPGTLTVLPRRHWLPPVTLPGASRFRIGGDTTGNAIGNEGEFMGLREYRSGDPLRLIHWRSWARAGKPVVRELENTHYPRYGLVVDTFAADANLGLFEEVVAVAASFAAALDTRDSLLDMMFVKGRALTVTAGRGVARADKLLEALAAVEAAPEPDFGPLLRLVLCHRDDLASCLVVLCGWDATRRDFVARLAAGGVCAIPLVVGRGERPPDVPGYWLEAGQLARDLGALPARLVPPFSTP